MPVRLLLLLALLGAGAASAQEPAPASAPTLPPPPLVSASEEDAPLAPREESSLAAEPPLADAPTRGEIIPRPYVPGTWDERIVPRVGLEVLGGSIGGFAGGGAGFLLGLLLGAATVGCNSYQCLVTGMVGGVAGLALGVPAGTYLGAGFVGGRGTFGAAVVGSILGWGAAALGLALVNTGSGSDLVNVALLALPVAGASLCYEVSHANHLAEPLSTTASRPRVVPLAGFTPSGPRLGLAGVF